MNRAKPVSNKIIAAEWERRETLGHLQRLDASKKMIDTSAPATYGMQLNRAKRNTMMEERYRRIERDNQILLQKMADIMQKKSTLDNVNNVQPHSLNAAIRRRELERINADNQAILKRIQSRKAFYDRKEWADHAKAHETYLENLREKPVPRLINSDTDEKLNLMLSRRGLPPTTPNRRLAPLSATAPVPGSGSKGQRPRTQQRRRPGGEKDKEGKELRKPPATASPLGRSKTPGPPRRHVLSTPSKPAKGGTETKKQAAGRARSGSDSAVGLAKEGRHIDGQYVIVYVDEHFPEEAKGEETKATEPDGFFFRTYDVESTKSDGVLVTFEEMRPLVKDPDLLSSNRREELATTMLPRLRFREGKLVFDKEESEEALREAESKRIAQEAEAFLKESESKEEGTTPAAEGAEEKKEDTSAAPAAEASTDAANTDVSPSTTGPPPETSEEPAPVADSTAAAPAGSAAGEGGSAPEASAAPEAESI